MISQASRIVKLVISAAYYFGLFAKKMALRLAGAKSSPACVVLYYHAVAAEHRGAFARQMNLLRKLTTPITLHPVPELPGGARYAAVTFDDFFQGVIDNALPELEKRNIPATIFVTTEVMGKYADWWPGTSPERQQQIASVDELRKLPADSVLIGSHTLTHPRLPELSESEAMWEIAESRRILESLLERKITTFSFPFGAFNEQVVASCRLAGYERVFTTLPTMAFENRDEFVTGRVKADPTDWPLEFRLKLLGAYQWLPYAFVFKRRLLSLPLLSSIRQVGGAAKSEA